MCAGTQLQLSVKRPSTTLKPENRSQRDNSGSPVKEATRGLFLSRAISVSCLNVAAYHAGDEPQTLEPLYPFSHALIEMMRVPVTPRVELSICFAFDLPGCRFGSGKGAGPL